MPHPDTNRHPLLESMRDANPHAFAHCAMRADLAGFSQIWGRPQIHLKDGTIDEPANIYCVHEAARQIVLGEELRP